MIDWLIYSILLLYSKKIKKKMQNEGLSGNLCKNTHQTLISFFKKYPLADGRKSKVK